MRWAFLRFFACEQDLSHDPPDAPLPEAVASGVEPFLVVGAIRGDRASTTYPSVLNCVHLWLDRRPRDAGTPIDERRDVLRVDGAVEHPLDITFSDLAALPTSEQVADVSRFHPKRRGDGVALEAILERAHPKGEANYLTLHADRDDFHVSVPLEAVRGRGDRRLPARRRAARAPSRAARSGS